MGKENHNLQKWANMQESRIFYELVLPRTKAILGKNRYNEQNVVQYKMD